MMQWLLNKKLCQGCIPEHDNRPRDVNTRPVSETCTVVCTPHKNVKALTSDLRFVKKFTRPDFLAKNFTHQKYVNCNYFYSKRNSINALISVILVAFLLEFN